MGLGLGAEVRVSIGWGLSERGEPAGEGLGVRVR